MRLREFVYLYEGIKLKSVQEIYAYACVVSEEYDKAPEYNEEAAKLYDLFYKSIEKMLKRAKSDVNINYTPDDPYSSPEEIGSDIIKNKNLDIYSGHSDHPVMSPDKNVAFRAVHDYFAHIGPNRKSKGSYKSHNFTLRGEYNAYLTHTRLAPKATIPILFTEVVGQASYSAVVGEFPIQKATILKGFDYINLGIMDKEKTKRYHDILVKMKTGKINLNINGGTIIDVKNIDWSTVATSGNRK